MAICPKISESMHNLPQKHAATAEATISSTPTSRKRKQVSSAMLSPSE